MASLLMVEDPDMWDVSKDSTSLDCLPEICESFTTGDEQLAARLIALDMPKANYDAAPMIYRRRQYEERISAFPYACTTSSSR